MASKMGTLKEALGLSRKQRPGNNRPNPSRDEYKAVWNAVSGREMDAVLAVSGHTDEAVLKASADNTVSILRECVGVDASDVILEIGAGVGRVGDVLAPQCREWIGVDVSENMLQHAKSRLSAHSNVRLVGTNGHDLAGIASDSVDLVYCTVVFMHLEEWDRYNYIVEALRVLRPGGRFLVDNINLCSDMGWALFEQHRALPPTERPANISKTSTSQELVTYLTRAGYDTLGLREVGPWIYAHGRKPAG